MSAALVVAGLLLLSLPGLRALPLGQLTPGEWTRAVALALRIGHVTIRLGLLFGAAPTVLRALGIEHAADACQQMFGPVAPGGPVVGWACAIALCALTSLGVAARRAHRSMLDRTHVEPWVGEHQRRGSIDVVTLPVDTPVAYAVPIGHGQIVLSAGLVAALEPAELEAVIAHERSHLRRRHDRYLQAAAVAERAYRWLWPAMAGAATLRLAIERWADEDAAGTPAERTVVRTALAKTTSSLLGPALAFASTCTVLQRLDALEDDPPAPAVRTRLAALAPLLAAGVLIVALLGVWSTYSHHGLLGILGFCPAY